MYAGSTTMTPDFHDEMNRFQSHVPSLVGLKFGLSPSCAKDTVREMEYDLHLIWEGMPRHFKAYAVVIPTNRKWLVSWCWMRPAAEIDPFPVEDQIILPVSDILDRVAYETIRVRQH
jgi:hypothetical protein